MGIMRKRKLNNSSPGDTSSGLTICSGLIAFRKLKMAKSSG